MHTQQPAPPVIGPGQRLARWLDERGISEHEAAQQLGMDIIRTRRLIDGIAPVTQHAAVRLSVLTGISAQEWLLIQARYDRAKNHGSGRARD